MVDAASNPFIADRIAFVNNCIKQTEGVKPTIEDASQERKAWIIVKDVGPVMVHYLTVADVTAEEFNKIFVKDYLTVISEVIKDESALSMTKLEDLDGGRFLLHQQMKPGIPFVSNRSMLVQSYFV